MIYRLSTTALLSAGLLAGCANPGYQQVNNGGYQQGGYPQGGAEPNRTLNGAVTGALIGGALGIGSKNGDVRRAAVGAAVGGLVGGAVGATLDRQAAELRNNIGNSNVSVTNTGNSLIVNLPQDILFATDSANLRPDLTQDLRTVAQSLLNYPDSTVQVIGHTDNTGSAAYNQDLSQRRAFSVSRILQQNGVPGSRIQSIGRGEDQPIASNLSASGRAQNRRVEIVIRPNQAG